MSRFALLAVICLGLAIALLYEGGIWAIQGVEAVVGIGMPRLVFSGLVDLALSILLFNLSWLTFRGARQQFVIVQLVRRRHSGRTT